MTVYDIQHIVGDYFNMPIDVMNLKTRKREIVQVRQIAMYLSKEYTGARLVLIGKIIGNKDHATVIYACKTITDLIDTDKEIRGHVDNIIEIITNKKEAITQEKKSELEAEIFIQMFHNCV